MDALCFFELYSRGGFSGLGEQCEFSTLHSESPKCMSGFDGAFALLRVSNDRPVSPTAYAFMSLASLRIPIPALLHLTIPS